MDSFTISNDHNMVNASDSKDSKQSSSKRQTFSSQADFILLSIGGAVGLGNIWRFPYLCYKNGGGAFLIPYFISYIFVATPMYLLEIGLGQYTTNGCIKAWNLVPSFKGIGYACQIIGCYIVITYNVILGWAFYYLAMSFRRELPWETCGNTWNTNRCFIAETRATETVWTANVSLEFSETAMLNHTARTDAVEEFYEYNVLKMSDGIEHIGQIVPHVALSTLVGWIVVYLCVCRGVKISGKIAYFTALFPYIILTILTIKGLTLDGAAEGIKYYLKPNFSRLLDSQVWVDAGSQVMFSLGVGFGSPVMQGSYNTFKTNFIRNSMVVVIVNCLTSLYGGFAVFSVLGFMAKSFGTSIDQVVRSGPGLVFIAYPKALTKMPVAPVWSVLFFMMVIFVCLDSQFLCVESFMTPIIDAFPKTFNKDRNRMVAVGIFCITGYLLALPMLTEGGIYVFQLMDYYACNGINLLLICLAEALVIGWIFGADLFYDAIELMTGRRYLPFLKICWKYIAPVVILGIILFNLVQFKPLMLGDTYEYPLWATIIGVLFLLSSTLCIPITVCVYCIRAKGSVGQRWKDVTLPVLKEHQIHPNWFKSGVLRTLQPVQSSEPAASM